jgi:CRISPR/Cas system endoribonuclease Cas6 (RAMP superfamily)
LPFKGRKVLTFCVNFKTNVSLPDYVGLGKGSSVGFGVVKLIENEKNKLNNEI